MKFKFLFGLGLVFTMIMSPAFANNQYISAAPASSIYDASVPNAFDVKNLDSMDMNIMHNTSNTGCIGEDEGPYNGNELGGNYSYIKCNNGPADMTGAIKDGYGEKLSDQTFTIRISYTGYYYESEDEDSEPTRRTCHHRTNIQLPYATRNLPQFTENLINDHVNCSNNCTVDQSEIDDVFRKINDLLTNQDTGYYNKTVIGDWYIYQGNHEYPGVNKKISDLSKNRRLFVPAGDDLWLVNFDSSEFDLYSEYYTGKSLLGNTAMKYSAGPVYSSGRGSTNTIAGEVFYIGEEQNTNKYFRVVNTFLVCNAHIVCRREGCTKNVASSGVTAGNFEKYVSHYCEDHACGFCWMTANATNTYTYSSLYSYERLKCLGSNEIKNNEPWMLGLDDENIDLRYLAWEGIMGITSAMTPDSIEDWLEDLEDIYPHEFCATHRCDMCEKPIIGRNLGDARFEVPEVYQGKYREMYSNYCEEHCCEHFLCNKPRVNSERSEPTFNFLTGRRTNFYGYCSEHCNDCGIVIVHKNSDETLTFYEKGCFVYDDAYTLYRRPVCLEDIISRFYFTKSGDRYIYSISRDNNGNIRYSDETQRRCKVCGAGNMITIAKYHYILEGMEEPIYVEPLCATCVEFQPLHELNMDDKGRRLLTDYEYKKLRAYNPMRKVVELKEYNDFIYWADSETGAEVQGPQIGATTSSSALFKYCNRCGGYTLWHNISASMRICSRCYCDESGEVPNIVVYY